MCTGQKRGIRTGYCSPLFNWFTYFNSQGRCLDSEWPNEQTFSFSLALVRPPRRIFYLQSWLGKKKGGDKEAEGEMCRYSPKAKRNSSKALAAEFDWIIQPLLNISFRGSKVSWLNLLPMSPRSSTLQPIRTPPVADGTLHRPEHSRIWSFYKTRRRRCYPLSTFVAAVWTNAAIPKTFPPKKTDNILYHCSHKGSHKLLPSFGYQLGCLLVFYFSTFVCQDAPAS